MSMILFEEAKEVLGAAMNEHLAQDELSAMTPILGLITGNMPPASSSKGRHGGFDGGLACHVRDVWEVARGLAAGTVEVLTSRIRSVVTGPGAGSVYDAQKMHEQVTSLRLGSVLKVCILHDVNKTFSINSKPHYIPNILAKGGRSDQKPWRTNPESEPVASIHAILMEAGFDAHPLMSLFTEPSSVQVRDGQISLAVAEATSPGIKSVLTFAERHAVIYHDGAFVSQRDGVCSNENSLQMVLHAADMIASRFLT
jgi:hypothetical protein